MPQKAPEGDEDNYLHYLNPKYEYRNTKQIQNPNVQMFKTRNKKVLSIVVIAHQNIF